MSECLPSNSPKFTVKQISNMNLNIIEDINIQTLWLKKIHRTGANLNCKSTQYWNLKQLTMVEDDSFYKSGKLLGLTFLVGFDIESKFHCIMETPKGWGSDWPTARDAKTDWANVKTVIEENKSVKLLSPESTMNFWFEFLNCQQIGSDIVCICIILPTAFEFQRYQTCISECWTKPNCIKVSISCAVKKSFHCVYEDFGAYKLPIFSQKFNIDLSS